MAMDAMHTQITSIGVETMMMMILNQIQCVVFVEAEQQVIYGAD